MEPENLYTSTEQQQTPDEPRILALVGLAGSVSGSGPTIHITSRRLRFSSRGTNRQDVR